MSHFGITRTTETWHGPFTAEFQLAKTGKSAALLSAVALGQELELQAPLWVLEDCATHQYSRRVWATLEGTSEPMGVKIFLTSGEEAHQHARRLVYMLLEQKGKRVVFRLLSQRVEYRLTVPIDFFATLRPPQKLAVIMTMAD